MNKPKKFSRFVFFLLLVLESVTLVIVIGFLYAHLNTAMSLEFQHKTEAHQNELRYFLKDRIDHVQNRVEEIAANNGIRVSLLLKMVPKIEEIMSLSYPGSNGSGYYIRTADDKILPGTNEALKDIDLNGISSEHLTRIKVTPAITVLVMPIVRQGYILGHALAVYEIAKDPKCRNLIHTFRHTRLVQQDQDRLQDLGTGRTIQWSGKHKAENRLPKNRQITVATQADGDAFVLPVIDFPDLYLMASSQPLTVKKKELLTRLFLICLHVLALTLTVSFLIIRKITAPLDTMAKNAREMTRSRATDNLSLEHIHHEEFLRLAKAFNRLLSRVRQKTDQLGQLNQELRQEVSERQRVATALASSESELRSLQENIPIGLFRSTLEGRVIFGNSTFLQIMGFESEEAFKEINTRQLYQDPDERRIITDELERVGTVQNRRLRLKRMDGTRLWAHLHVKRVQTPEIDTIYLDGAIQDITPLVEAENEKQRLETQLRQAQKMETIGTLAGGIAHDFNNILAAINGFCELALEDATPDTIQSENLQWALEAASRASELVRQILAFARQSDEEKHPVRVDLIIKETIKFLRSTLPSTIEVREKIMCQAVVMADPTQLHQVITNLCSNAGYAMQSSGGTLDIQLRTEFIKADRKVVHGNPIQPGEHIRLSIIDTGHGIPTQTMARIFEPYYTTKPQGEGTGIGLSVVQGIVHSHGGFVTMESTPGQGTRCEVFLPVIDERELAVIDAPSAIVGGSEHILLVDDEQAIVNMGQQILERMGYLVTPSTDPRQALTLFKASPRGFDLVITDLTMPKLTGDQLTAGMKQIRPDLPVILVTGYSEERSEDLCADFGFNAILYKPMIKRELAKTIRDLLDKSAKRLSAVNG